MVTHLRHVRAMARTKKTVTSFIFYNLQHIDYGTNTIKFCGATITGKNTDNCNCILDTEFLKFQVRKVVEGHI